MAAPIFQHWPRTGSTVTDGTALGFAWKRTPVGGLSDFRFNWPLASLVVRGVDASLEGDGKGVERCLPSDHSSCPTGAGRVEGAGREVEALQRGLIVVGSGSGHAPHAASAR